MNTKDNRPSNQNSIVNYLSGNIRTSIINDVKDVVMFHSFQDEKKIKSCGFFSVPRQVFCYVDFLGLIAYHSKPRKHESTENAINFIKEFFPGLRYKLYADLLYSMWRHGTVHSYEPKAFHTSSEHRKDQLSLCWFADNSNNQKSRERHLQVYLQKKSIRNAYIFISTCQLVDDLLISLDNFVNKLRNDSDYAEKCYGSQLVSIGGCVDYSTVIGKKRQQKVKEQIEEAIRNCVGEVDERGNVIKEFCPPRNPITFLDKSFGWGKVLVGVSIEKEGIVASLNFINTNNGG